MIKTQMTTCRVCERSWPMATVQAHCVRCHRHFAKPGIFDDHWGPNDEHRDPQDKHKLYVQDETGMWKGVMDEATRARLGRT